MLMASNTTSTTHPYSTLSAPLHHHALPPPPLPRTFDVLTSS